MGALAPFEERQGGSRLLPLSWAVRRGFLAGMAVSAATLDFSRRADRAAYIDRRLAEHEWIAGDRFTIADIVAVVGLEFARLIRYRPPEEHAQLGRWLEACRARPAAQAGM